MLRGRNGETLAHSEKQKQRRAVGRLCLLHNRRSFTKRKKNLLQCKEELQLSRLHLVCRELSSSEQRSEMLCNSCSSSCSLYGVLCDTYRVLALHLLPRCGRNTNCSQQKSPSEPRWIRGSTDILSFSYYLESEFYCSAWFLPLSTSWYDSESRAGSSSDTCKLSSRLKLWLLLYQDARVTGAPGGWIKARHS